MSDEQKELEEQKAYDSAWKEYEGTINQGREVLNRARDAARAVFRTSVANAFKQYRDIHEKALRRLREQTGTVD